MSETSKTMALTTQRNELVKQYLVYDGNQRVIEVYTAPTDAGDGIPCTLTQYTYVGLTSRVEKRKESMSLWDATWDI